MAGSEDDSDVDAGFHSDVEEAPLPKRRSLLVALRFPMKRPSSPKQKPQKKSVKKAVKETPQQRGRRRRRKPQDEEELQDDDDSDEEALSLSLKKRNKNIQENKAMLATLFADLSTMADLALSTPTQKKKRESVKAPRKGKTKLDMKSKRKNPSRKARPPKNFAVEEKTETLSQRNPRKVDLRKLMQVDEDVVGERQKMKKRQKKKKSRFAVRPVDDITKEDLDNIVYCSKLKIYDKDHGSSCHQCRQKTLDTKTVCRSGFCVGVRGQFCGLCLKNRYGEDVRSVLLDPKWACPICRGICNCSVCRKKEGRCATGLLVALARFNGHDNVHEYLKNIQKELK
ncbi:cell division cycle-associated 7-like protein isoform X2 [Betta splendens]|nr:cell division cycle-associated 7-like protein isoform X2 [Betta splendens]